MTTLYIKTHKITGLKYFGMTKRNDIEKYKGSGKYWLRHLRTHGNDIHTEIFFQSDDIDEVSNKAIEFSISNNIVESKDWANLKPEDGRDGGSHTSCYTQEVREKISKARKGTVYSDEYKIKMSERCKGINKGDKNGMKGYKFSDESLLKIKNAHLGVKRSNETRQKIKESALNRADYNIVCCPHCGKEGKENAMKRWHFDRCIKINPDVNKLARERVGNINKIKGK